MAAPFRYFCERLGSSLDRVRGRRLIRRGLYEKIDWEGVSRIHEAHKGHPWSKYFKYDQFLARNAARIYTLGLQNPPSKRVLDIGCGFGYFLYAAREMGHQVQGIDVPDPLLNDITDLLGISKVRSSVKANEPLPDIPNGPFNLITAFETCFNQKETGVWWGVSEWKFFLNDLLRFADDRCELFIKFNVDENATVSPTSDELIAWLISLGGDYHRRTLRFPDLRAAVKRI